MLLRGAPLALASLTMLSECIITHSYAEPQVTEVTSAPDGTIVVTVRELHTGESGSTNRGLRVFELRGDDVQCSVVPQRPTYYAQGQPVGATRYIDDGSSSPRLVFDDESSGVSFFEREGIGWRHRWTLPGSSFSGAAWTGGDGQLRILTNDGLRALPDRGALPPPLPLEIMGPLRFVPTADDEAIGFRVGISRSRMARLRCTGAACTVDESGSPAADLWKTGSLFAQADGEVVLVFDDGMLGGGPADRFTVVTMDSVRPPISFHDIGMYAAAPRPDGGFALVAWSYDEVLVVFMRDASGMTQRFELGRLEYSDAAASFTMGATVVGTGADERVRAYFGTRSRMVREILFDPGSGSFGQRDLPLCE